MTTKVLAVGFGAVIWRLRFGVAVDVHSSVGAGPRLVLFFKKWEWGGGSRCESSSESVFDLRLGGECLG